MTEQYANKAQTTIAEDLDNSETVVTVTSNTGFPTAGSGDQYRVIVDDEIMIVTSKAGGGSVDWTVTRGAEGTAAATHSNGANITHILTAASLLALPVSGGIIEDFTMWMPDAAPGTAGPADDEFDGEQGAGAPTGWTEWDHGANVTVSEEEHGLTLSQGTLSGADSLGGVYRAISDISAGDFTVQVKVGLSALDGGLCWAGICVMQDATSSTGDVESYSLVTTSDAVRRYVWSAYNSIAGGGEGKGVGGILGTSGGIWLRLRRATATYIFDVSLDGYGWNLVFSGTLGYTPAHIGLFIDNRGSGGTAKARFSGWRTDDTNIGIDGILGGDRVEMGRT